MANFKLRKINSQMAPVQHVLITFYLENLGSHLPSQSVFLSSVGTLILVAYALKDLDLSPSSRKFGYSE